MHLGFQSMNTPEDPPPGVLGPALEERGFESLWMGEHSHIPVRRTTPYPAGGELPRVYTRMMDPIVGLTLAAAATTTLRLGTGVALPLEHDVFALAKSVATLDVVSGGRVLFGVGTGWNVEELADHSPVPWAQRYRALADCVAALKALWRDDEAEHHGEFYDFDPVWAFPKPAQRPHPPIICGTAGRLGTRHAVAWADGWAPTDAGLGDVAKKLRLMRDACAEAGRDPMPVTMFVFGDPTPDQLHGYADLGVARCVIGPLREGWEDAGSGLAFVDRYADLAGDLDRV